MRKSIPMIALWRLCINLLMALVSLYLSVSLWKLGPEYVSLTAVLSTQIFDETEAFLQNSIWWLPHVWILKLNNLLYLLVKDSCIIFILFLCYIQQILVLVAVLHSSWIFLLVWSLSARSITHYAINWLRPPESHNFLNYVYNAYSHKWHIIIYIYTLNLVESNQRDGATGNKYFNNIWQIFFL